MKTHLTILAALVVATPLTAQTSFGVRGGMTHSTLAVSEDNDEVEVIYQSGFHFGVTAALGSGGTRSSPLRGLFAAGYRV